MTDNIVNISGGTVDVWYSGLGIIGGYSASGAATGNVVNISGGTVKGSVYAGKIEKLVLSGKIKNNIVYISGTANLEQAAILGYSSNYYEHEGNILNIANDWEGKVEYISNFDSIVNKGNLVVLTVLGYEEIGDIVNEGTWTAPSIAVTGKLTNNGTVNLTGDVALSFNIEGTGTTVFSGAVNSATSIAQANLVLNGTLTAEAIALTDSLIWKSGTLTTTNGLTGTKALVVVGSGKTLTGSMSGFKNYLFALDANSTTTPMLTVKTGAVELANDSLVGVTLAKDAKVALNLGQKVTLIQATGGVTDSRTDKSNNVTGVLSSLSTVAQEEIKANTTVDDLVNRYAFGVGAEGSSLVATVTNVDANGVTKAIRQVADSSLISFRSQMNDVSRRMGELRGNPEGFGAWARVYGGRYTTGEGMKEKSVTLQIGGDKWFSNNFYAGLTGAYTKADDTFSNGDNDQKNWNLGLYGGYFGENGLFWDATFKVGRFGNDFNFIHTDGAISKADYHTWGQSFSLEGGWRLQCPSTNFYVEPQAELMYGHLNSVTFTDNLGVTTENNKVDTFVARLGVAAGYNFAENRGNAYVKASVLHDSEGKVESRSRSGATEDQDSGKSRDLGGTWGEFAIGGTYKATQNLNLYGELMCTTKAAGVRTKWQGSVGMRYMF